jgi:hypothetical protein
MYLYVINFAIPRNFSVLRHCPCYRVRVRRLDCYAFWLLRARALVDGVVMAGHDHGKAAICVVYPCNCKKTLARRHVYRRH